MSVINTNIRALASTNAIASNERAMQKTMQSLSSGSRINRASDDAAGLSIATMLEAKSRVYSQGIRNINDGISMLNIAEGATKSLVDIVTRQMELAQQAANGTFSGRQRLAITREADALQREYNRIVESTEFNGVKLFQGAGTDVWIQQGADSSDGTRVTLGREMGFAAGDGTFTFVQSTPTPSLPSYQLAAADFDGDGFLDILVGNGANLGVLRNRGDGTVSSLSIQSIDLDSFIPSRELPRLALQLAISQVRFPGITTNISSGAAGGDYNNDGSTDTITSNNPFTPQIQLRNDSGAIIARMSPAVSIGDYISVADINNDDNDDLVLTDHELGTASIYLGNGDGTFGLSQTLSPGIAVSHTALADINGDNRLDIVYNIADTNHIRTYLGAGDGTFINGAVTSSSNVYEDFIAEDLNNDGILDIATTTNGGVDILFGNSDTSGRRNNYQSIIDLHDQVASRRTLLHLQRNLTRLNKELGNIGAMNSRLEISVSTIGSRILSYQAAQGRIVDTDYAQDSAEAVRLSIFKNTATAILAQANMQPQIALKLLK
jgi:flagellin